MIWRQLNSAQRAALNIGSSGVKTTKLGRYAVADKVNAYALAKRTLIELERDVDRARDKANLAVMGELVKGFDGRVVKLKAGHARGSRVLNKPRAGAMNMGFYKGTGFGA